MPYLIDIQLVASCQHIPVFVGLKAGFGQSSKVLEQDQIPSIDEVRWELSAEPARRLTSTGTLCSRSALHPRTYAVESIASFVCQASLHSQPNAQFHLVLVVARHYDRMGCCLALHALHQLLTVSLLLCWSGQVSILCQYDKLELKSQN